MAKQDKSNNSFDNLAAATMARPAAIVHATTVPDKKNELGISKKERRKPGKVALNKYEVMAVGQIQQMNRSEVDYKRPSVLIADPDYMNVKQLAYLRDVPVQTYVLGLILKDLAEKEAAGLLQTGNGTHYVYATGTDKSIPDDHPATHALRVDQ